MKSSIIQKGKRIKKEVGNNGRKKNSKLPAGLLKLFGSIPSTPEDDKIIEEIYRSRTYGFRNIPD